MSATPVERRARYKKKEGVLTIDATHLHWTPDREGVGRPLRLPLSSIKSQHVAKNAAALLRLIAAEHPKGLVFEFGAPPTPAWADRDAVRDVIFRTLHPAAAAAGGGGSAAVTAAATGGGSAATGGGQGAGAAADVSAAPAAAPGPSVDMAEIRRRGRLLQRRPDIKEQHARLVMSHALSDDAFWHAIHYRLPLADQSPAHPAYGRDGMDSAASLAAATAATAEPPASSRDSAASADPRSRLAVPDAGGKSGTRGVPTALVSLEPAEQMGNTVRYVLNPAKIHQIFVEQPDVHRAYLATVPPGKLTEQAFWNKYFASRVFSRGAAAAAAAAVGAGARARAAAAGATPAATEADELFAQYEAGEAGVLAAEAARRVEDVAVDLNLERADPPGSAAAAAARSAIRAAGLPPPVLPPSLVGGDAGRGGSSAARRGVGGATAAGAGTKGGGGSLPLMRRVNRHGALVNDSLTTAAAWAENADDRERPLTDLAPMPPPALTPLNIHNHSAFRGVSLGEGGGGSAGGDTDGGGGDSAAGRGLGATTDGDSVDTAVAVAADPGWASWSADLSYLLEPSAAAGCTLQRLSAEIAAQRS
ncbi:hypothetical protein MMPV_002309 [Pyropia vietnamensis]